MPILSRHPPARTAKFHYLFESPSTWTGIYGVAKTYLHLPNPADVEEITILTWWGKKLRYKHGDLVEETDFDPHADPRFVWHLPDMVPDPQY